MVEFTFQYRGAGSIPGGGAKIPHAGAKKPNTKQKQRCNELNKDFKKNGPHKKKS